MKLKCHLLRLKREMRTGELLNSSWTWWTIWNWKPEASLQTTRAQITINLGNILFNVAMKLMPDPLMTSKIVKNMENTTIHMENLMIIHRATQAGSETITLMINTRLIDTRLTITISRSRVYSKICKWNIQWREGVRTNTTMRILSKTTSSTTQAVNGIQSSWPT
jgi:hypothetical protein